MVVSKESIVVDADVVEGERNRKTDEHVIAEMKKISFRAQP